MDKAVAWYLVELERELKGRLTPSEISATLQEVEAHLLELQEELLRPPVQVEAEDLVRLFGSPGHVAAGFFSREHSVGAVRRALPSLAVFALCLIALVPVVGLWWHSRGGSFPFAWIVPISVLPFAGVCLAARRFLVLPILTGGAAASLLVALLLAGFTYDLGAADGRSILMVSEYDQALRQTANNASSAEAALFHVQKSWRAIRSPEAAIGATFEIPTHLQRESDGGYKVTYSSVSGLPAAKEAWRIDGQRVQRELRSDVAMLSGLLTDLRAPKHTFWVQLQAYLTSNSVPSGLFVLTALGINALVLLLWWLVRFARRVTRRPRVATAR